MARQGGVHHTNSPVTVADRDHKVSRSLADVRVGVAGPRYLELEHRDAAELLERLWGRPQRNRVQVLALKIAAKLGKASRAVVTS